MSETQHATTQELTAALDEIRRAPRQSGVVRMIVARPSKGRRRVLPRAELSVEDGLVGDNWKARGGRLPGGVADPERQLTVMNARALSVIAHDRARWKLAGDQLIVDFDLSAEHLAPGTVLELGTAAIEVTAPPHTGCKKFVRRFGMDAMLFVNSEVGRQLNLRGINARVVRAGVVEVDDTVAVLRDPSSVARP